MTVERGMALPARLVAEAAGCWTPPHPAAQRFEFVTSTVDEAGTGSLFVCLSAGEQGAGEIHRALDAGSAGVLCAGELSTAARRAAVLFPVHRPLLAYRELARLWRERFSVPVVAVAGSAGKTTTKELLACALSGAWHPVLKTEASRNGDVGIPMTLLALRPRHRAAVVEIGIDRVGAMDEHLRIVRPTAGLVTVVGAEHLDGLGDVDTVAAEQGRLLTSVDAAHGVAAINVDDERLRPYLESLRCRRVGYSMKAAARRHEPSMMVGRLDDDRTAVDIEYGDGESWRVALPVRGRHNAGNVLAACALARALGHTPALIAQGLRDFRHAPGRSQIFRFPGPVWVIADHYNANPVSMPAALHLLASEPFEGVQRRIACLGDMLELGVEQERYHRGLARDLLAGGIDDVCLVGPAMAALGEQLHASGFEGACRHFSEVAQACVSLVDRIRPGDAVLVKGSRAIGMERIVRAICERQARECCAAVGS